MKILAQFFSISIFALSCFPYLECDAQTITVNITVIQQACNNDGAASVSVSGGIAPYRYYWYGPGFSSNAQSVTNLPAGIYHVNVRDTAGSYGFSQAIIGVIQIDSINTTHENCNHADGSASVFISGGTAPYVYAWSNGVINSNVFTQSATISNLTKGLYGLTISDAAGCILEAYSPQDSTGIDVRRLSPVTTTITATPCNCNDGTATVIPDNGTPPYSYFWSTFPPQFTQTASGLEAFTYPQVTIIDASGCEAYAYTQINPGPNYLQSTSTVNYAVCPTPSGSITLNVSGGTPPYTYSWSTGQTTSSITNLPAGNYTCQISDAAGCTVTRTKLVQQVSPISLNYNISAATCGNADGLVTAVVSNGTPPYTYAWSNGQTTVSTNFPAGWHYLIVTDANNCPASDNFYVSQDNSCYAILQGTVWHDINGNCSNDAGDFGLPYPAMQNTPYNSQNTWMSNGWNGSYSQRVIPGTYSLAQFVPASWTQVCPSNTVTVNATAGNTYTNDFYNEPDSLFDDLTTYIYCNRNIVRGTTTRFSIYYTNSGTTVMNGTLEVHLDTQMGFINSSPLFSSFDVANNTAYFTISNLLPRMYGNISLDLIVPNSVALGDTVQMVSVFQPVSTDAHPGDNTDTCTSIVVGSYDPNEKQVAPAGEGTEGYISTADSILRYTVFFQNTGNYPAVHVKVIDTLDQHLDASTVLLVNKKPNNELRIERSGQIITFDFPYIYLSDTLTNEPGSHGFISFTVKQNWGLPIGTVIKNRAGIYFDMNEPIITNEVINTIHSVSSVKEIHPTWTFNIVPNPAKNMFELRFSLSKSAQIKMSVYDMVGRRMIENSLGTLDTGEHSISLDVQQLKLEPGVYFVNLLLNEEQVSKKLVVVR